MIAQQTYGPVTRQDPCPDGRASPKPERVNVECEDMKRNGCLFVVSACAFLASCFGCGGAQTPGVAADSVKTCIQGKVWMKNPVDSNRVPYGGVTVTAWRHGKDLPLAETRTDRDGNYCIEVPGGEGRVDLRVWGTERMEGKTYICQGTAENIDPGKTPKRCGEDCFRTDLSTQCEERAERRIGG